MKASLRSVLVLLASFVAVTCVIGCARQAQTSPEDTASRPATMSAEGGDAEVLPGFEREVRKVFGSAVGKTRATIQDGGSIVTDGSGNTARGDVELTTTTLDEHDAYLLLGTMQDAFGGYSVYYLTISFPAQDGTGIRYDYYWNTSSESQTVSWGVLRPGQLMSAEFRTTHPAWNANGIGDRQVFVEAASRSLIDQIAGGRADVPQRASIR